MLLKGCFLLGPAGGGGGGGGEARGKSEVRRAGGKKGDEQEGAAPGALSDVRNRFVAPRSMLGGFVRYVSLTKRTGNCCGEKPEPASSRVFDSTSDMNCGISDTGAHARPRDQTRGVAVAGSA